MKTRKWTMKRQEAALREGWLLALVENHKLEIQRRDSEMPRFVSDAAALLHIQACAEMPSELHLLALELIVERENELARAGRLAVSMGIRVSQVLALQ